MIDYTSAVDALAKFEYTKLRNNVIERYNVDPEQVVTWDELEPSAALTLKEDALDSILEIETHLESIVLSRIAEESYVPQEVLDFITSRTLSNDLDTLFSSED